MIKLILVGASGKMGQSVKKSGAQIVWEVDKAEGFAAVPSGIETGVVLDFSHPSMQGALVNFCEKRRLPLVCATTGLSSEQIENLKNLSKKVPVLISSNFSVGVFVMAKLAALGKKMLEGWDSVIIEKHHKNKIDAPSGTAKLLKEKMSGGNEIDVFSVRAGTTSGEHEVTFFGEQETLSISHSAQSRDIFALGALKACEFLAGKNPRLYCMEDIFG